jgi:hypothetical protein
VRRDGPANAALVGSRDTVSEPEGTERESDARITLNAGTPLTKEGVEVTSAVIDEDWQDLTARHQRDEG